MKKLYFCIVLGFSLFTLLLNLRLYSNPSADFEELSPHLSFLKQSLEAGSANEMQTMFPEGYVFSYVLYGASWINLGIADPQQRDAAVREARWALAFLDSDTAKIPFRATVRPPLGVFYLGWTNWLRGGILKLDPEGPGRERFQNECQVLSEAFAASEGPFLDAYYRQAWPCDSTVAVAALALHDTLYEPRFQQTIKTWVTQIQATEVDGLLSHKAPTNIKGLRPRPGDPDNTIPRGTSQVMILRFMYDIDPVLAERYYFTFRRRYVTTRFGLPGAREYPVGVDGPSDADSGPLIFGFSLSVTGVLPGAARLQGDQELFGPFQQMIATFGFPVRGRYLLGQLPLADALLVWSRTTVSWTDKPQQKPSSKWKPIVQPWWRWGFHIFGILLVGLAWLPLGIWRLRAGSK